MKKLVRTIALILAMVPFFAGALPEASASWFWFSAGGGCGFSVWSSVAENLQNCQPQSDVIKAGDYSISGGARERVVALINRIILIGSLVSVGAIAYAGFLYATTVGDDERIKKGKTALKFGIIGFIVMLVSFPLVNAIVNFVYSIGA